jgi:hypothetical protein
MRPEPKGVVQPLKKNDKSIQKILVKKKLMNCESINTTINNTIMHDAREKKS